MNKQNVISKKNILMICSWLSVDNNLGSFFWEQATIMESNYSFVLCSFEKKNIRFKNFTSLFIKNKFKSSTTDNGIQIFNLEYNSYKFLPQKINKLVLYRSVKKFNRYLIKNNFNVDLIHAQSIFDAGIVALHYHKKTKIPFVFTEHNQFSLRDKTKYEIKYLNQIFSKASRKMVVSYDKIRQFAANGIFSDFDVVGNAIDENIFNYDSTIQSNTDFQISTIGAFDLIKDQKIIFEALALVDKMIDKPLVFNWIGFNGWGVDNTNLVSNLVSNYDFKFISVKLYPKLSRTEIALKLQTTNLFVFSSISEGFPVSVIEALACGVPVCTTRCGGVDEIINDVNGKMIQIKDIVEMKDFILYFLQNENKFDRNLISYETIKGYGRKAFFDKIDKLYKSVI
ncbi:glycosyltransferase family 4 protein [Flavobacterium sp.]|jgi:glycosyltransferase involved in cell wall biosynthesis|uniref:glycosyltransferase family 4 protein n=1 Tax=Flavobacterium sp. TaxID=239 RepID=UPI0037C023FF